MFDYSFDWSGTGIDVYDGFNTYHLDSIDALLDRLDEPTTMVCEATFESYLPDERERIISRVRDEGHTLLTYHPKWTAKYRADHDIEKSDTADSKVIWCVAQEGRIPLRKARHLDPDWAEFVARVNREHTISRFKGEVPSKAAECLDKLGALSETQELVFLTAAGKPREHFLAAIYRAANECKTRAEFESLLGLSANGYPSHLRSDVHHWGYRGGISGYKNGPRVDWHTFRKEVRRAYHILRS